MTPTRAGCEELLVDLASARRSPNLARVGFILACVVAAILAVRAYVIGIPDTTSAVARKATYLSIAAQATIQILVAIRSRDRLTAALCLSGGVFGVLVLLVMGYRYMGGH